MMFSLIGLFVCDKRLRISLFYDNFDMKVYFSVVCTRDVNIFNKYRKFFRMTLVIDDDCFDCYCLYGIIFNYEFILMCLYILYM